MTLVACLNAYTSANLLLVVALALVAGLSRLSARLPHPLRYRDLLRLGYAATVAAALLPSVVGAAFPPAQLLPPTAQVWSAPTMKGWSRAPVPPTPQVSLGAAHTSLPLLSTSQALSLLLALGLLAVLVVVLRDAWRLHRLVRRAATIRRLGRLHILAVDDLAVPCSWWLPHRSFVLVPTALVPRREDLLLALRHEVQHHRQHDTKWLYALQLLRALFFWNPAAHLLERHLADLQEFACDEALAGHQRFSPRAYCRCLLWVADSSRASGRRLVGTASLTPRRAGKTLKRRIESMLDRPKTHARRPVVATLGTLALVTLLGTAYAAGSAVHDRRVSLADAERLAETARETSDFPIVVNDLVLAQLNRFVGTPDGRDYMKGALERMRNYREQISADAARYGLPEELLAVPIVESAYKNRAQDEVPAHGAGLWMFIASTARHYGLKVDRTTDERLDVMRETDAAMRLLGSLHLQFQDWGLALLAYNGGNGLVEKGLAETGSRDVWDLVRKGYENDPHYVAEVMAAVLILKNPQLLN